MDLKFVNHKLVSAVLALLFLILVQSFNGVFRFLLGAMFLYTAALMAYNYWYLHQHNFYTFWSFLRPLFFLGSIIGIYFVLPAGFIRGFFVIVATILIFVFELGLLSATEQVIFLETLFSYFGLVLAAFAYTFFLLPKSWIMLLVFFFLTFLVARASFEYIPQPAQKKNFFSWLIALAVLELSWTLLFIPLHFSVLAIILFNVFYLLWIIVYYYMFHNLTSKKVGFHLVFSAFLIILALISTPWR